MDELFVCRQIMRMHSCLGFEITTSRPFDYICPDITRKYEPFNEMWQAIFHNSDIEMYRTAVESTFGNSIDYAIQVLFIYKKQKYFVPVDLINAIYTILKPIGHAVSYPKDISVYWGYTGRRLDRGTSHGYITDGLQRDTANDIILDFATYELAQKYEMLHFRLVHEVLHSFGLKEDAVKQLEIPISAATYGVDKDFVHQLLEDCSKVFAEFKQAVSTIQSMQPDLISILTMLSEELHRKGGFPVPPEIVLTETTELPISYIPQQNEELTVLFM